MNNRILNKLTKEELEWILKNPLAVSNAWEAKAKQSEFTCDIGDCFIEKIDNCIYLYKVDYIYNNDTANVAIIEINETCIDQFDDEYTFIQLSYLKSFDKKKFNMISTLCETLDESIHKISKEFATKAKNIAEND